jgi:hypothetical protein
MSELTAELQSLREAIPRYAHIARREGIWALRDLRDLPPFYTKLLDLVEAEHAKGGDPGASLKIMLLGMLLIYEGDNPGLIEEIMGLKCDCGDFYAAALHDPSRIAEYR